MAAGERKRGARWAWIALSLSVLAVLGALVAGFGTGQGWWTYGAGLKSLPAFFGLAVLGALVGMFARFGRRDGKMIAVLAVLVGAGFAVYLGNFYRIARSVPAIHDATTDLADPPQFRTLPLRADNLAKIPDLGRPGWDLLPPDERWRAVHADAYGDLKPLRLATPPAATLRKAEQVARELGWAVAAVDPRGQVEATDTTRFFRFRDDVVIRIRPGERGGSVVDVRSVSRVGISDLGENARRVRRFLKKMREG